jgi:outer membrane protein
MKNVPLILSLITFLLVIALFFTVGSLHKKMKERDNDNGGYNKTSGLRIAFINDDSVTANYLEMIELKKDLEGRQAKLQEQYDTKAKRLQEEYNAYQQKAQSGNISQLEAKNAQEKMGAEKEEVEGIQQQLEELTHEAQLKNQQLLIKIQNFVAGFNKKTHYDYILTYSKVVGPVLYASDSLDITRPVVNGLNAMYKDSIQGKSGAKPQ